MNYYEARQKQKDGEPIDSWHWTCMNSGKVYSAGACTDGECFHKTKEEAEDHEGERLLKEWLASPLMEIDTKFGHDCYVKDCKEKAFYCIEPDRHLRDGCDYHLKNPVISIRGRTVISSY